METARKGIGVKPPAQVVEAVRALVEADGELAVAKRLCIGRGTVARIIGALRVRPGTVAQVRERLGVS